MDPFPITENPPMQQLSPELLQAATKQVNTEKQSNVAQTLSKDVIEAASRSDESDSEKKRAIVLKEVGKEGIANDPESVAENKFMHGVPLFLLMVALMAAVFMTALDSSIIATAIPRMTSDFNSLNDVAWYGNAYLLTQMSMQPTFGRVFTFFNLKWTYIGAFLTFEVGSIVCAAAPTSNAFIVGRAVAGVGASGMFCGGLLIIQHAVPLQKRPLYMSIVSTMFGIASVLGPVLGGVFTDSKKLTWRFCFWINLPLGALALLALIVLFQTPPTPRLDLTVRQKVQKLDFSSAFILTSSIVCLLIALQYGGVVYPWSDARVWGCLIGFTLLTSIFIFFQIRKQEDAVVPIRIISQRTVAISCTFKALLQVSMTTQSYYLPIYFQSVHLMTARDSGLRTLMSGVTVAVMTLLVGAIISATGIFVPFMWAGSAIFTVGSALLYMLRVNSGPQEWLTYQVVTGIGFGAGGLIPFYALQAALKTEDISTANALIMFFQCFGGAVGLSVAQNIFEAMLKRKLETVMGLDVDAVISAGASGILKVVKDTTMLVGVLDAYNFGLTRAFILCIAAAGVAFACSLRVPWMRLDGKKQKR